MMDTPMARSRWLQRAWHRLLRSDLAVEPRRLFWVLEGVSALAGPRETWWDATHLVLPAMPRQRPVQLFWASFDAGLLPAVVVAIHDITRGGTAVAHLADEHCPAWLRSQFALPRGKPEEGLH